MPVRITPSTRLLTIGSSPFRSHTLTPRVNPGTVAATHGGRKWGVMSETPDLLTTGRFTRRVALVTPVALVTACASSAGQAASSPQIEHIVAFKYKPTVTQKQKTEVIKRFLALKQKCKRNGKNYVVSLIGGDCTKSLDRLTDGFEHVFIVTFKNRGDYRYYIGRPVVSPFDPAHDAFKKFVTPLLSVDRAGKTDGAIVLDFQIDQFR